MLSRRNSVPEKWLTGVLASRSVTRTEAVVARIAEEQQELKEYESMDCDGDGLDIKEKVMLCCFQRQVFGRTLLTAKYEDGAIQQI